MDATQEISRLFFELQSTVDELKEIVRTNKIIQIAGYELPIIPAETKELPSFEERKINVSKIGDEQQAVAIACRAYSNYFIDDKASNRFATRCPGIIQLAPQAKEQTLFVSQHINGLKDQIKSILTAKLETGEDMYTRSERFNILRGAIPGVVALKLYRHIQCIPNPLKSVSFTWANKQSVSKIALKPLKELLEDNKNNLPSETSEDEWVTFIDKEIKAVVDSKAKMFKFRRPIPPAPMVNLRFLDKSKAMRHAHLPIIVFGDESVKISPLKSYVPNVGHYRERLEIEKYLIDRLKILPAD